MLSEFPHSMLNLVETPKETGNKVLNKSNWKIRQIKMQQIFYIRKMRNCDVARNTVLQ